MLKRKIGLCVFIGLVVFLSGIGFAGENEQRFGGELIVAHALTPLHLDTDRTTDSNIGAIMFHVFEGLFEIDSSFMPVPHLAERYIQSADGTLFKFILRQGVLFHNGREMTAADVAASFARYLAHNGAGRSIAPYVAHFEAESKYVFSVQLTEPYAPFLSYLSSPAANQKFVVRAKETVEATGDEVMTDFVGTGPFRFVAWESDQYVKLERFEDYQPAAGAHFGYSGEKVAYVDRLTFQIVRQASTRVAGVQSGAYHFADFAPRDQLRLFELNPQIQTFIVSPYRQSFIIVNMGHAPFDNVHARQALLHAIDIEEFGYAVVGDPQFWTLNPSLFPPGHIWHVPDAGSDRYNVYDPDLARELLDVSGYDGRPIIILNSREDDIENNGALVLQSQLSKVGFNVEVRLYDRATVVQQRARPDGYHLHLSQFSSPDPDPQVYGAWMGTNRWIGNWDDEDSRKMDQIFNQMRREPDYERRYEIVEQWHEAFYHYVPYVKLYDFQQLRIAHRSVQGVSNFPFPVFFNVWLDQ